MEFVADFHIHSKYSRATSKDMDVINLAKWANLKGVNLLGTGDFTHHLWLKELKKYLLPLEGKGLYTYKGVKFILSAEISSIFSQNGKVHKVHNLVLAPSFEVVKEINRMLSSHGNINSDGRPILGLSCYQLAEELFKISSNVMLIPAHIWTPWFSVFGSNSGFNNLEEAFGKYTEKITALETGLSSDPEMNWMVSALDKYSLVSNSDSHSPSRIGREANVFNCDINYWEIKKVLETKDKNKFLYTIEFFPGEGKYYYDGHRKCKQCFHPLKTKKLENLCPVCGRLLTKGVLNRIMELADREYGFRPKNAINYRSMIALDEIIANAKGVGKQSKAVEKEYLEALCSCGTEFSILNKISVEKLSSCLPEKIVEGIKRVRGKKVNIFAGYDGEYGEVEIFPENNKQDNKELQTKLF